MGANTLSPINQSMLIQSYNRYISIYQLMMLNPPPPYNDTIINTHLSLATSVVPMLSNLIIHLDPHISHHKYYTKRLQSPCTHVPALSQSSTGLLAHSRLTDTPLTFSVHC